MEKSRNSNTDIPGSKSPTRADVGGDSPKTCPKCGQPLKVEYGTGYCHKCRVIVDPKPRTNGDRIRSMSDEELARFLNSVEVCENWPLERCYRATDATCIACTLDWLKQPAKEVKQC